MTERLTPLERQQIRESINAEALAKNPQTCRALLLLLDERDKLEAAMIEVEALSFGGKGESVVHMIAENALR